MVHADLLDVEVLERLDVLRALDAAVENPEEYDASPAVVVVKAVNI